MENSMGTSKVNRLVFLTGLPMIASLLINSLYNFVDSVFVSRLSEDALTAVSLSAPVQLFMSALGLGIAVGLNAVISRALGAKENEKAAKTASAAIWLALFAWILIVAVCILMLGAYCTWQADGDEVIAGYGREYLSVCMLFSLGQMLQWVFDRFVMASGKSYLFLFTLSAASVTNLILDPIFIFGLFGVPAMGIRGAAIATVTGQFVGAFVGLMINRRFNREIPIRMSGFPDGRCLLEIIKIGFPSSLVQIVTAASAVAVNSILIGFSTTAVAVYGICARLQNVVTVGMHGINNGVIPIVAFNYGAKKADRIQQTTMWAILYGVMLYIPFFLVLEIAPLPVLELFHAGTAMQEIGTAALRIMAMSYFLSVVCLCFASVFQGFGLGMRSMGLTMLRQVILPLGFMMVFRQFVNVTEIWWVFVLAEVFSLPAGILLYRKTAQQKQKEMSGAQ